MAADRIKNWFNIFMMISLLLLCLYWIGFCGGVLDLIGQALVGCQNKAGE
jgi:hypothetical protein